CGGALRPASPARGVSAPHVLVEHRTRHCANVENTDEGLTCRACSRADGRPRFSANPPAAVTNRTAQIAIRKSSMLGPLVVPYARERHSDAGARRWISPSGVPTGRTMFQAW